MIIKKTDNNVYMVMACKNSIPKFDLVRWSFVKSDADTDSKWDYDMTLASIMIIVMLVWIFITP